MKIIIVGGGFAGIKASKELSSKLSKDHEIILIDKNKQTTMLPNLPELVSERLKVDDITESIEKLLPEGVKFANEEITNINLDEKNITTTTGNYSYDYLLLASGSITNFYGFNKHMDKVHILESVETAKDAHDKFIEYMNSTENPSLVISGAGFTGIELACSLYDLCKKNGKTLNVNLVEFGKKILPMLSDKTQGHVVDKLNAMKFNLFTDNTVADFDGKNITLKNGEVIENVFFAWCSGVKNPIKPIGEYESLPDGRLVVNEFLSLPNYKEVFVAGDAAATKIKGQYLRRAVTFSQMAGKQAGKNLAAAVKGEKQTEFAPIDLGWVIPIYHSSIGVAFGSELTGRKGIFMHYFICGIKNYSFKNFLSEAWAAIKYPFAKV